LALCRRGLALCIKSISNIWPRGCSNGSTPAADIQMPSTDTNANHPEEGLSKSEAELIQNRPTPGNPVFGLRHPARPTRKSGTAAFWVLTRTLSRARPWIWKSSGRTERGRLLPSFCGSILPSRWTITRTVGFCRLFCAKFCAHRNRITASTASPAKTNARTAARNSSRVLLPEPATSRQIARLLFYRFGGTVSDGSTLRTTQRFAGIT
jgi:hypothetical protein